MPASTLIVGLGNTLRGDDGVGVHIAQELASLPLPGDVKVISGGTMGLGLVSLFAGRRRIIFADAADMGKPPGTVVRFVPDQVLLTGQDPRISIHEAGLRDMLLLARELAVLPAEVIIYGVQPTHLDWDNDLSPAVRAAIPQITRSVCAELET